ncbi:molybdenum cofactor sulfurylase [Cereibacter ovatus]|uniref:Molybdenum cofactor sulfurylase n=1 Tax=Cereibacter ovatus TaxID=439529 RepID=A0A285D3L8_9RHOB|nr:xanthine dehydrogenase accessory protein XdhC [Cereibacter ovatus]SNX74414.1 molybdenum cofactor sulfurylase [Cereibacter ovatus]
MAEGFDLDGVRAAVAAQGRVARIVVAACEGSAPREVGAAMLVWAGGSSGTIGGGALEWQAMARARDLVGGARLDRVALGPGLGQCCGGAVTLLTEVFGSEDVARLSGPVIARSVTGAAMPLAVRRLLARARAEGVLPVSQFLAGWMVEPAARPGRPVWVWGAGHVGRAVVSALAPLPDLDVTWIDAGRDRFPDALPDRVTPLWAHRPEDLVAHAPAAAEHLVLTYSHALDLELCHRIMAQGFRRLGLIGSATKAARFRARLRALGHPEALVARLVCPIGDKGLGKHPQAIALGIAVDLLKENGQRRAEIAS